MNRLPIDYSALYQPHKAAFERYRDLLVKWNQRFNLTSIDRPDDIYELHFLDSMSVLALLSPSHVSRETKSVLDIGAGAGFPGIPIKIVRPEIRLTLVDSAKKKCDFIKEVVRSLALSDVGIVHQRLAGHEQIGEFDLVVSRAAFRMPELIQCAVKNLRRGGLIVGMKGEEISEEIRDCTPLLKHHQLSPIEQFHYTLPVSGKTRSLLVTRSS